MISAVSWGAFRNNVFILDPAVAEKSRMSGGGSGRNGRTPHGDGGERPKRRVGHGY